MRGQPASASTVGLARTLGRTPPLTRHDSRAPDPRQVAPRSFPGVIAHSACQLPHEQAPSERSSRSVSRRIRHRQLPLVGGPVLTSRPMQRLAPGSASRGSRRKALFVGSARQEPRELQARCSSQILRQRAHGSIQAGFAAELVHRCLAVRPNRSLKRRPATAATV